MLAELVFPPQRLDKTCIGEGEEKTEGALQRGIKKTLNLREEGVGREGLSSQVSVDWLETDSAEQFTLVPASSEDLPSFWSDGCCLDAH